MRKKSSFCAVPAFFQFAGSHERLFERFKNKSPEDVEAYIDAMLRVQELNAFNSDTDMAAIPLNTQDRGFNSWKTLRPREFDTPREDGPINVNR